VNTVADVLAATVLVAIIGALVVAAIVVVRRTGRGGPLRRPPVEQGQTVPTGPSLAGAMDDAGDLSAVPATRRDNDVQSSGRADEARPTEPPFLFTGLPDALTRALRRDGETASPLTRTDDAGAAEPWPEEKRPADGVDALSSGSPFLFIPSPPRGDVESPMTSTFADIAPSHEGPPPVGHSQTGGRSGFRASLLESVDPISGVPPHVGDNVGVCARCGAVYSSRSVESITSRVGRCVICNADWAQVHPRKGIIDVAGQLVDVPNPDRTPRAGRGERQSSPQNGSGPSRPTRAWSSRNPSTARRRADYEVGDLVEHDFYGLGEVSQVDTRAGMGAIIWISFDGDPDDVPIIERYRGMRRRS
jgi:hypothetical protein